MESFLKASEKDKHVFFEKIIFKYLGVAAAFGFFNKVKAHYCVEIQITLHMWHLFTLEKVTPKLCNQSLIAATVACWTRSNKKIL